MSSIFGDSGLFLGVKILVSDLACTRKRVQVRFPRSKRKRVQRKWSKDPSNWKEEVSRAIYQLNDGSFVMDRVSYAELCRSVEKSSPPPSTMYSSVNDLFFSDLRSMLKPLKPHPLYGDFFSLKTLFVEGGPHTFKW